MNYTSEANHIINLRRFLHKLKISSANVSIVEDVINAIKIQEAINNATDNFGTADQLFLSPRDWKAYRKALRNKK